MNRTLINSLSGTAILILFLLTAQIGMADDVVPMLPMTLKGVATINGSPAPVGTSVEAYMDGQPAEKFLVNSSSGDYCFWISGTAEDEGKPVTFMVDGKDTGKSVSWKSGMQILSLNLSAGEGADPVTSIKGLYLRLNSEILTKIGKLNSLGKNPESKIIESSVPAPDLKALEKINSNSGNKGPTKSSEGSSKLNSVPGFSIFYAIAGIVWLALRCNTRKN